MSGSVMNIGLTALNAAQAGLVTTGQNISNASTAGYNRQRVDLAPQVPQLSGGGFFGRGVSVENVRRSYSEVLDRQTQLAQTQVSFYDTYATQVNQIGNLVADPASGLSPAMQEFFRAVQGPLKTGKKYKTYTLEEIEWTGEIPAPATPVPAPTNSDLPPTKSTRGKK